MLQTSRSTPRRAPPRWLATSRCTQRRRDPAAFLCTYGLSKATSWRSGRLRRSGARPPVAGSRLARRVGAAGGSAPLGGGYRRPGSYRHSRAASLAQPDSRRRCRSSRSQNRAGPLSAQASLGAARAPRRASGYYPGHATSSRSAAASIGEHSASSSRARPATVLVEASLAHQRVTRSPKRRDGSPIAPTRRASCRWRSLTVRSEATSRRRGGRPSARPGRAHRGAVDGLRGAPRAARWRRRGAAAARSPIRRGSTRAACLPHLDRHALAREMLGVRRGVRGARAAASYGRARVRRRDRAVGDDRSASKRACAARPIDRRRAGAARDGGRRRAGGRGPRRPLDRDDRRARVYGACA